LHEGDAQTILHHLKEIVSRYETGTVFFCSLLVTDQERAMRLAASLFMGEEDNTETCLAHDIQLCVNDVVVFTGNRIYLMPHTYDASPLASP
jgi:hypothetical protein